MRIGALHVSFMIFDSGSLKQKRKVMRSVKDKLQNTFNVSVAEVKRRNGITKGLNMTVANKDPSQSVGDDDTCFFIAHCRERTGLFIQKESQQLRVE